MASDRFYLLEFRNRPVYKGDIGSLLKISGLVVEGGGAQAILLLPSSCYDPSIVHGELYNTETKDIINIFTLSVEEWSDFIQRSDVPELMGPEKVFHRKARFEISGAVQQKVWRSDGLKCVYCKKLMGDVALSIDHFMPIELGGINNHTNYLSACKKCNKDKGSEHPVDFCKRKNLDYEKLVEYLKNRKI